MKIHQEDGLLLLVLKKHKKQEVLLFYNLKIELLQLENILAEVEIEKAKEHINLVILDNLIR